MWGLTEVFIGDFEDEACELLILNDLCGDSLMDLKQGFTR
jgi:hypothetical protein